MNKSNTRSSNWKNGQDFRTNFNINKVVNKKIQIKIIDELEYPDQTSDSIMNQCQQLMLNYRFVQIEFEPIRVCDVIGGSSTELIHCKIYGRIDLAIARNALIQEFDISQGYNRNSIEQTREINPSYSENNFYGQAFRN